MDTQKEPLKRFGSGMTSQKERELLISNLVILVGLVSTVKSILSSDNVMKDNIYL